MAKWKDLDELLRRFTDGTIPGCACAVMREGELVYEGYAGYADVEKKAPVTERSLFRQASTTKLFTYVIGMMLYEQGKFLFTDPLYEYLPEWRNTCKYARMADGETRIVPVEHPITVRDAFTMSCGLPYCMRPIDRALLEPGSNLTQNAMSEALRPYCENGRIPTIREEVRAASTAPIMFEPGTHWQYGFGSEIVGALVEELTGKSVRQNMLEKLIEPLELKDTATLLDKEQMERLVTCYQITPDHQKAPMPADMDETLKVGSVPEYSRANLNCSARDFAVFMSMLANGGVYKGERLIGKNTIDLMRTNQLGPDQLKDFHEKNGLDILGYGYGMGVRTLMERTSGACNGDLGAFGWSGGFGSWAEASPEKKMGVVYMHNTQGERNEYFHMKVRAVVYGCMD